MFNTSYVCFACRKSVKHQVYVRPETDATKLITAAPPRCPDCASVMLDLGTKFKAPRRSDLRQWRKVKLLWDGGFSFNGYAKTPDTPQQVEAFLKTWRQVPEKAPSHPPRWKRSRRKRKPAGILKASRATKKTIEKH